jgi:hypothetical protein
LTSPSTGVGVETKDQSMATWSVNSGDTWQSIASGANIPLARLLLANGCDPSAIPELQAGSQLVLDTSPPVCSVAAANTNTVSAPHIHKLAIQVHDDDGNVMTAVPYRVSFFGNTICATSPDGWVTIAYPYGTCAAVDLSWGAAASGGDGYLHETTIQTDHYQGRCTDKIAASSGSGYTPCPPSDPEAAASASDSEGAALP